MNSEAGQLTSPFACWHKQTLWLNIWWWEWRGGSQHTNQPKTKHCSHLCPLICWCPASKEKPAGGGWDILNKRQTGEAKALGQGEATVHQEAVAGALKGGGGATRGDATTSQGKWEGGAKRGNTTTRWCVKRWWHVKRLWRNKKPRNNQPGKWEATANQEVLTHQERERRHEDRRHNNQPGQTRGTGT